jgi:Glycosyl hydrolase family 26
VSVFPSLHSERFSRLFLGLVLVLPSSARADPLPLRDRVQLGAYVQGLPYFEKSAREFVRLEQKLGTRIPILSGFVDWDYTLGEPRDLALTASGTRTLLYSWEPHCMEGGECVSFAAVARGDFDAYLQRVVESMRKFPYDLYVRPWGEMNADWSAWQPNSKKPRAGTPEEFIAAWRHVYEVFQKAGVHNLKFVFNPDATHDSSTIPIERIWPGAAYVDVLGIDGYNWGLGTEKLPGEWSEFDDIFAPMYQTLTALHPTAPLWICEVGSKEPEKNDGNVRPAPRDPTHKKSSWIDAMMSSQKFPRLTALIVFNVLKERDFRFESSADSLRAIRRQLAMRSKPGEKPSK